MIYHIGDNVRLFHERYCSKLLEDCKIFSNDIIHVYLGEGHYHEEKLNGIVTKISKGPNKLIIYAKYFNGEEIGVCEDNVGLLPLII